MAKRLRKGASQSHPLVIVTGLSGSGKRTALRVFEDLRFFCVDGLPASMIPKLTALYANLDDRRYRGLALGIDLRQYDLFDDWDTARRELADMGVRARVVFLEARDNVLLRRYAETRRPHPLESQDLGLEQAVSRERELLEPIRSLAELVIDTSDYSIHDLRRILQEKWSGMDSGESGMRVHVISFGYKYGVPKEADLVFDLRFLPNPFHDEKLRPLSGKDKAVADYVLARDPGRTFMDRFLEFLRYLLPLYAAEGRYRLAIAMGCTGGRHRSVALSERLFNELKEDGLAATIEHRHFDLG